MATQSFTLTSYDFSSSTGIRSQGSQISTALQDAGLTKTSDTGQINWTTTTTGSGYEVYRFNDTLQSTQPLYLLFQYSASTSWQYISSITMGTGTNGAGSLTGGVTALSYAGTAGTTSTATGNWTWRFNYNATRGFFGMSQWAALTETGTSTRSVFAISRSCDMTGAPVGSGVLGVSFGASTSTTSAPVINYETGTGMNLASHAVPGFGSYNTLAQGTNVQFLRSTVAYPTVRSHPQILYYANADIPRWTTVSLSPYGTSYSYITCGGVTSGSSGGAYAMLWE